MVLLTFLSYGFFDVVGEREERGELAGTARMKILVERNKIILTKYKKLQQHKTNTMF